MNYLQGATAVEPVRGIRCYALEPAYGNTVEGCLTPKRSRETDQAVREVFKGLTYEAQRWFELTPENPGEWMERAKFWKEQLRPVLPPGEYHSVMILFCSWYARCIRRRLTPANSPK